MSTEQPSSLNLMKFTLKEGSTAAPPIVFHDRRTAIQNIKDFRTMNRVPNAGAVVGEGGRFNGFYVDMQDIKDIINSDPDLTGISFYIGKHPSHTGTVDPIISIYFTGAKPNPAAGGAKYINPNTVEFYEYVDPCPPSCGDLEP